MFEVVVAADRNCAAPEQRVGADIRGQSGGRGVGFPAVPADVDVAEAVADDARSRGVADYLEKTTTDRYEVLAEQVRNAIRKRQAERRP